MNKRHFVVYANNDDYCAWPSIARAGNGDILVTFCLTEQHISPNGRIALVRSRDNGATWSEPEIIRDSILDDRQCGLTPLGDGQMLAHFWSRRWTREEYEKSWFTWVKDAELQERWLKIVDALDPDEAKRAEGCWTALLDANGKVGETVVRGPETVHGGVRLADGDLLVAGYLGENGSVRVYRAPGSEGPWQKEALVSSPQPNRFSFSEPHLLVLPTGRVLMLIRADAKPYENASPLCVLWETYSDDGGRTWVKPFVTPLWGFPPHLALLADGRVLATYGYRRPPYGQRACVSRDGVTWDIANEIVLREDAPNADLGYPASLEIDPGKVLTVYYQVNKPRVSKSLEYSRPAGEKPAIMATLWTVPTMEGGSRETESKKSSVRKKPDIQLAEPHVVAVSAPGEKRWGHHQFPHIGRLDDGHLAVNYSIEADSTMSYGATHPACVSADGGKTWRAAESGEVEASAVGAIVFPDGELIKFPQQKPLDATKLDLPANPVRYRDLYTREADCYRLGDLPEELRRVKMLRRLPGENAWREEWAVLDVPDLVVQVIRREASDSGWSDPNILVQPHIATEFFHTVTPDGGLLIFTHLRCFNPDPERFGVDVLRSDDRGRTWRLWGIPGWFRDEAEERAVTQPFLDNPDSNYSRLWGGKGTAPIPNVNVGGLYEPGVVSFGDGRMVCVMRTDTGGTHEPCFVARSTNWGKTWSKPEILTPFGVMPKMLLLDNGVISLVYGRPGVQLLFCTDGKGELWQTPMNLLPEPGEKTRAMVGRRGMETTASQVGHDDTCGNCTVLKTGPNSFLVAYSDFRHKDASGKICKAIKVQEITVILTNGDKQ